MNAEKIVSLETASKIVRLEYYIYLHDGDFDKGFDEFLDAYGDEYNGFIEYNGLKRVEADVEVAYDEHGSTQVFGYAVYSYGLYNIKFHFAGDTSWGDGPELVHYYLVIPEVTTKIEWTKVEGL